MAQLVYFEASEGNGLLETFKKSTEFYYFVLLFFTVMCYYYNYTNWEAGTVLGICLTPSLD